MLSQPVKESAALRSATYTVENQEVNHEIDLTQKLDFSPSVMEAVLDIELPAGAKTDFCIVLSNDKGEEYRVGFDAAQNVFYSDRTRAGKADFSKKFAEKRHTAPRSSANSTVRLHLFFDVASCELFADDGAVAMTDIYFPTTDFNSVKLLVTGGETMIKTARFYKMTK